MKRLIFLWAMLLAPLLATAPITAQPVIDNSDLPLANSQLADPEQEHKAAELMESIRCLQCQGQSIADSDAPIAATMRHEIRSQMQGGKSAEQVQSWLISRYGDWVTFDPAFSASSWPLYVTPLLILLVGGLLAWRRFGAVKTAEDGDAA